MVQTRSKRQSVAKVLEVKADKAVDNAEVKVVELTTRLKEEFPK